MIPLFPQYTAGAFVGALIVASVIGVRNALRVFAIAIIARLALFYIGGI